MASEFSLLSWAKPQSSQTQSIFGDNFMSGNFHREIENINFDNFEFMPEFDFDGFFKKVETTPKTIEEPGESKSSRFKNMPILPHFFENPVFVSFSEQNPPPPKNMSSSPRLCDLYWCNFQFFTSEGNKSRPYSFLPANWCITTFFLFCLLRAEPIFALMF